jgi:hypothetical protein
MLIDGINDWTGMCVQRREWTSKYAYAYLKLLERKDLWPARLYGISISKAIKLPEKMSDPIPEESSIACTHAYKHAAPEYRKTRYMRLDILDDSIGLCLYCVRSGCLVSQTLLTSLLFV